MKTKVCIAILLAISLILVIPTQATAQYDDSVSDSSGDVFYWRITDDSAYWDTNANRDDIDITQVSIDESGGTVTVSITVKGTISDTDMVWYYAYLEDENEDSYTIQYEGGNGYLGFPNGYITPTISGIGTDTLEVSFSLTQINNPSDLTISEVGTYDWIDSENQGEYYYDVAGPDATEPVDDGNGGSDGSGSSGEISEDWLGKIWAGSLFCIALGVIIPIIVLVVIIFLIFKVIKGSEEKGKQPPQQSTPYQQPPKQEQPPQESERTPPPPEDQTNEKDLPPPPEDE